MTSAHPAAPARIAVSGTYSTGKSSLTEALSIATGLPRTHALTSREILAEINPEKTVMELDSLELIALGMRRYAERLTNESGMDRFVSDGSVIHEWVYGAARAQTGINPGAPRALQILTKAVGVRNRRAYAKYLDLFGDLARERAASMYDAYVHLPVEFPLVADGHRPVSEPFRALSDTLLHDAVHAVGLPVLVVRGSVEQRLTTVIDHFGLSQVTEIRDAVTIAERRVRTAHRVLEDDARRRAEERGRSVVRTLKYALRY
ncbi:ATP-binding protein [Gordonia spumicola]|uniref:ATP-binding protein n=1 Tax=Gordonia spumicola TaxID=589161 RepID=A0A7I9V655_9ACTN|nr:AAA family ATPase [Gordonia spumicola]GEE00560.1 ATP-binding protein [Gordonia spumicola]